MRHYFAWVDDSYIPQEKNRYVLETEWDVGQANEVRPQLWGSWKIGDIVVFPSEWVNKYAY